MKGSWRDRPSGSRFSRLWRPWETLHPFRGKGRSINEPKSVGIRDLVAPPGEVKLRPERRWYVIGGFFFLLFLLLVGRLYVLQVKDYKQSSNEVASNAIHKATIPASRGLILDRNGQPLVNNVTTVEIRLSRAEATLNPSIEGTLASLTGLRVGQIAQDLANKAYNPYQPAPILANAPATVIQFIKLHPSEFPGVSVLDVSQRSYPLGGSVGSQVLGYVGPITENEIKAHPGAGYQTDSTIGKTGIEAFYEQYLRGHDGTSKIEVGVNGNVIGTLKTTQPRIGDSVVLNIDGGLQKALDGILKSDILHDRTVPDPRSGILPQAINGAAVVLDVNNGAVLAMSSYPSYNLSSFVNGLSDTQFHHLLAVGAFNNYAIQGLYTPGSTFKMISATAEMQTGILSPDYTIDDTGSFRVPGCKSNPRGCVFHDDETTGNGDVDLVSALTKSSDYYFYNLGYLFWSQQARYGQTPIQNVAREYGLDQYTDIDLPDEVEGRVDSPEVRKELHAEAPKAFPNVSWYTGDNIEMAFGQGTTALTPIALANAYATFANGGTRYAPEVAAAIVNAHGQTIVRYGPRVLGHVSLPPRVRNPILEGLEGVVMSPEGTAYLPFKDNIDFSLSTFPIAGKTGTATNGGIGIEPNSWFVGFGPTTHPKYVVLCVIDEGGYGADAAAPVVARTFNYLVAHPIGPLKLKHILTTPTTTTTRPNSSTTTTVPTTTTTIK
jgi:penicillin-binding protein 2